MKAMRTTFLSAACLVGLVLILAPAPAAADFVIADDLIVDGSACVGFDCVNGESFGFDTIRLKENNLRIHFNDTSSVPSFPTNDWRITINDSANGGAAYFGVEDADAGRFPFRIFAGARANALVVDAQGDIGIGTSTPTVDIHVKTGDTPTLRLEQDTSSGFQAQTWDVAGNETNFFIRDATNGSTLPLRIRPGSPSNSIYIDGTSGGDVGFGTSSPEEPIHVRRTDANAVNILVESSQNQNAQLRLRNGTTNTWDLRNRTNGEFAITLAGSSETELNLDTGGNMEIFGGLITGTAGSCTVATPCDGVFRPDEYTVESIDEHAAYMWESEHLRGVGPTPAGQPMNLTKKTAGILHELEKAHIYIEQLHKRLQKLEEAAAAAGTE